MRFFFLLHVVCVHFSIIDLEIFGVSNIWQRLNGEQTCKDVSDEPSSDVFHLCSDVLCSGGVYALKLLCSGSYI